MDLLSSEEEEDVSHDLLTEVDLDHCPDGRLNVVPLWLRSEEYLHRVGPTWNTLGVCVCARTQIRPILYITHSSTSTVC